LLIPYSVAEVEADQRKQIKETTIKKHTTELYFPHQQQGGQGVLSLLLQCYFLLETLTQGGTASSLSALPLATG